MSKKIGTIFIIFGLLLVLSAVSLFAYNKYEEKIAADAANDVLQQLQKEISVDKKPIPEIDLFTNPKMPPFFLMGESVFSALL